MRLLRPSSTNTSEALRRTCCPFQAGMPAGQLALVGRTFGPSDDSRSAPWATLMMTLLAHMALPCLHVLDALGPFPRPLGWKLFPRAARHSMIILAGGALPWLATFDSPHATSTR